MQVEIGGMPANATSVGARSRAMLLTPFRFPFPRSGFSAATASPASGLLRVWGLAMAYRTVRQATRIDVVFAH